MSSQESRKVLRYLPAQRFVHWMGAAGFLILLFTGSLLLWSPLAPLAAGGGSRLLHRIGAVLFVLWPVLYAILNPAGLREMIHESTTYTRDDLAWFKHAVGYFFGHVRGAPPQGRINAGQKIHHLGVIILFLGIAASGIVLWLGVGRLGATNLALATMVHDLCMLGLTVLLVGHLYFTFLYNGLDGMVKGYVTEEYARMEHPKWLATLPESAFIGGVHKPVQASAAVGEQPAVEADITRAPLIAADLPADQVAQPKVDEDRP